MDDVDCGLALNTYIVPIADAVGSTDVLFFRLPLRSNEPTNNQHFFIFLGQIDSQTKPQRKESFRETLVELSIETNSNYSGMRQINTVIMT